MFDQVTLPASPERYEIYRPKSSQIGLEAIQIDQSRSSPKLNVHTTESMQHDGLPNRPCNTTNTTCFVFIAIPAADASSNSGTVLPCARILAVVRVSMKPRATVTTSISCSKTKIRDEGIDRGFCGQVCNHIGDNGIEQSCHRACDKLLLGGGTHHENGTQ
jgi:hypothetical protein